MPLLLAVGEATVVARILGAPSIYSARLAIEDEETREGDQPAGAAVPV